MAGYARAATTKRLFIATGAIVAVALIGAVVMTTPLSLAGSYDDYQSYATWAGMVIAAVYVAAHWRRVVAVFGTTRTLSGSLIVVVVLIGLWFPVTRRPVALSPETLSALDALHSPLEMIVFDQQFALSSWRATLNEYRSASSRVAVSYVDPDREPVRAQQSDIRSYGTLVLRHDGRAVQVTSKNETDIRDGIEAVANPRQKQILFSQGHGERSPVSETSEGYSTVAGLLRRDEFAVSAVAMSVEHSSADSNTILIVAGPNADFLPEEVHSLRSHLSNGGRLLLMIDPRDGAKADPLKNLVAFAREWGFNIGDDIVIDVSGSTPNPEVTTTTDYPAPPAQGFQQMTAYSLARSITPVASSTSGTIPQTIVATGVKTWAETDLRSFLDGKAGIDVSQGEKTGPLSIAAAVSVTVPPRTRIVVFGDSDFASNGLIGISGNIELVELLIRWLLQEERPAMKSPAEEAARTTRPVTDRTRAMYYRASVAAALGCFGVFLTTRRAPRPSTRGRRSRL